MKKISLCFLSMIISSLPLSAQETVHLPFEYKGTKGKFVVEYYTDNIFNIAFEPYGYQRNEKISEASILRPISVDAHVRHSDSVVVLTVKQTTFEFSPTSVTINGEIKITDAYSNDEFVGFQFNSPDNEMFFGGGSRALPLNRRGHRFNLHNAPWYSYEENSGNLNYSVPFITSSKGYGLFFDNPASGYIDICATTPNVVDYAVKSGKLNCFIIFGSDPAAILHNYHLLTGNQPLPPKWVLGNIMSRFGYTSQAQVDSIVAAMQKAKIGLDAVIIDLFWFGDSIKNSIGNLDWMNKRKWPHPEKMIADLKKQHINTVLITEPYVVTGSVNFQKSRPYHATDANGKPYLITEFYFGNGGLLDLFRNDAQDWFWSYYKKQMDKGVEGWWGDLGEPETHPAAIHHNLKDLGFNRLFKADEVHNYFGHIWTKFLYEKFSIHYPEKRLFSLNRSGFAGTQRYNIFPWSGDVARTWGGFRAQPGVMLGMSVSGIPYMHSDAGGFAGGEGDNELYVRWLQFAVFSPILRPHGTALYEKDPLAFSYPSEAALIPEPYRSFAKNAIDLRYKMLPYNYTLSYLQTTKSQPLAAPLYYYFPNDQKVWAIEDQYMWGENILVAPVFHKNEDSRKIYLPAGTQWYRWNSAEPIIGGTETTEIVSLNNIPLFVKEGSFIPLAKGKDFKNTTTAGNNKLELHYYPASTNTSFTLFDDDGASKSSLTNQEFELIQFSGISNNKIEITVESNGGHFRGKPAVRNFSFVIHTDKNITHLTVNGHATKFVTGKQSVRFDTPFNSEKLVIELY